jgi:hypothetical protein
MSLLTNTNTPDIPALKAHLEKDLLPRIDEMVAVMGVTKINALMESFVQLNLLAGKQLTSTILALRQKIERCVSALYKEEEVAQREERRVCEAQDLEMRWKKLDPNSPNAHELIFEALAHVERFPASLAKLSKNLQLLIASAKRMRDALSLELDQFIPKFQGLKNTPTSIWPALK